MPPLTGEKGGEVSPNDCAGEGAAEPPVEYCESLIVESSSLASHSPDAVQQSPGARGSISKWVGRGGSELSGESESGRRTGELAFESGRGVMVKAGDLCTPMDRLRGRASESYGFAFFVTPFDALVVAGPFDTTDPSSSLSTIPRFALARLLRFGRSAAGMNSESEGDGARLTFFFFGLTSAESVSGRVVLLVL